MEKEIVVNTESERLDKYLAGVSPDYSRSFFQKLIKSCNVVVEDKNVVDCDFEVHAGDKIRISFPEINNLSFDSIGLDIIYEDKSVLVINKPSGVIVHPAGYKPGQNTIFDILMSRYGIYKKEGFADRPFIVHRLDKDTSGIMLIAKTPKAQLNLMKQFKDRKVKKVYFVLVYGKFNEKKGIIEAPLARNQQHRRQINVGYGRDAVTDFEVLQNLGDYALLEVKPQTGRTHQIRVHLAYIGHPVLGDNVYGTNTQKPIPEICERQMLHSYKITFCHPVKNKSVTFKADLPEDFRSVLKLLKKNVN
ncbi:MAG: hypothetical protein AUJ85_02870 [Elusimicrobia bacterium CG1_02_37_114]|nr:MAG: hypothetical protein AUJ85_02870 [Elusimicrobia bacterium CG1_02_37_114]